MKPLEPAVPSTVIVPIQDSFVIEYGASRGQHYENTFKMYNYFIYILMCLLLFVLFLFIR
jgi:hypothetical protein